MTILPFIPDNLTIPQFFLDSQHPIKPLRKHGIPWLVEEASGRKIGFEEVSDVTGGVAEGDFCSANTCCWVLTGDTMEYPMIDVNYLLGPCIPAAPATLIRSCQCFEY